MRLLSLLLTLFLALYATVAFDQPFDENEDDNADGQLDPTNSTLRTIGERCGRFHNFCEPGLDCVRSPILRRCIPVTCVAEAFQKSLDQTGFDLAGYGQMIMAHSGVAADSPVFRKTPNPVNSQLIDVENHEDEVLALARAIEENPPPMDLIVENYYNCTGSKATSVGLTPYFGASWELGALLTYNADIFYG